MKQDTRRTAPIAIVALLCVFNGCLLLTGGALPGQETPVHDSPGGVEVGSWKGNVTVLAVDNGWALVRMLGWVPATAVDCEDADGLRVQGSPGPGIWVTGVRISEDFLGHTKVTGRFVNATGHALESEFIELVFLDGGRTVLDTSLIYIETLPPGQSRAFAEDSILSATDVASVEFQM